MKIIVLSGIDKTGKTTIKDEINKLTNFEYCIIDRFIPDCFAYDLLKHRNNGFKWLWGDGDLNKKCFYLVYLYSNKNTLQKRFKQHNETDMNLKDYGKLTRHFDAYFSDTHLNYIKINTSELTIKQSVDKILKWIKKF